MFLGMRFLGSQKTTQNLIGAFTIGASLVITSLASPSWAADSNGRYAIDGFGRQKCSAFVEAREAEDEKLRQFAGWMDGYVSAFNHFNKQTYDLTPWQSIEIIIAKMTKYCKANPEEAFNSAFNKLAVVLYQQRLTEVSPVIQVRAGKQATLIYREMLKRVISALRETGRDIKASDGEFTKEVGNALRDFQKEKKLPISGLPDQVTLNLLFP